MITVSNLIWGFDFKKLKNPETGEDVDLDIWNYTSVSITFLTYVLVIQLRYLPRVWPFSLIRSSARSLLVQSAMLKLSDSILWTPHRFLSVTNISYHQRIETL